MRSPTIVLAAALLTATLGATAASAGPDDSAQGHVATGAVANAKEDYDTAIREFTKAIELDPSHRDAYHRRSIAYANKGDFDRSIADATRVIELAPADGRSSSLVDRGQVYLAKRDPDGAVADFDRAISLDARYAYAFLLRSRAWSMKGDDRKALADCSQAIKLNPDYYEHYRERGLVLQRLGDNTAAVEDFDKAVTLRDEPDQRYCRGRFLLSIGEFRRAADDLLEALDPLNAKDLFASACDLLGTAYEKGGLLEEGISDLTEMLEYLEDSFGPDFEAPFHAAPIMYTRYRLYRAKRAYKLAVDDLSALIDRAPPSAVGFGERGDVYREMGDLSKAVVDYTRAIELDARNPVWYFSRAGIRDGQGDVNGALADYASVIDLDPKSATPYTARGWFKDGHGDVDGAIADYRLAGEVDPRQSLSRFLLGACTFSHGGFRDSIAEFRAAIRIDSEFDPARNFLFLARSFCGERTEAATELRSHVAALPPARRDSWEITVARCLSGDITVDGLLAAAEASPPALRGARRCAALFYGGAVQLLDGSEGAARGSFVRSVDTGEKGCQEHRSAAAFLKSMPALAPTRTSDAPVDSPFTWTVPNGWSGSKPTNTMRLAQFDVGRDGSGEPIRCVVFGGIVGEDDAILARWVGQMGAGADGNARRSTAVRDGVTVLRLEVRGTYADSARAEGTTAISPATLLAAIVTGPGGKLHATLIGPEAIVDAQAAHFDAWIASMKAR